MADQEQTPFILISAPNGARPQKNDHPSIPLTASDLASEARELVDVGTSILHLHVRDDKGKHSLDINLYQQAIARIREAVGDQLILQITTEAVGQYNRHEQMALVRALKPEAVSLSLRELCPDENALSEASDFFCEITREGIWPQYILYSPEEVRAFEEYRRRGVFGVENPFTLFVLGRYSRKLVGDPADLEAFTEATSGANFPWATCCFGPTEAQAVNYAHQRGGHARIGFENNMRTPDGNIAKSNSHLIAETLKTLDSPAREIATTHWIRNTFIC